ncbi:hypothetical protein GYH30_001093, partial [Glycine max]|uniref:NmrA-like domain-containing protein n=1 Tax=Glycine max TaxID=3847 RepID=K7K2Z4_SOYBN
RFIPSKFGLDPTRVQVFVLEDGYNFYAPKVEIRRLVEAEGIPYTFISCNFFVRILLPSLAQPSLDAPPRDKVTIFFYGNIKVHDPCTLNKVLYLRPPRNVCSLNEMVEMWDIKIGKKLETLHVFEGELLQKIKGTSFPANFEMVFIYSAFIKGDHTYFDIESSFGVNGTQLYPHLKYTTVSEFLDTLV